VSAAPVRPAGPVYAAPAPAAEVRERTVTRFTARDYGYVRRELQRILILAAAVIVTIVILSFFLP
jgi:hypothetical protein